MMNKEVRLVVIRIGRETGQGGEETTQIQPKIDQQYWEDRDGELWGMGSVHVGGECEKKLNLHISLYYDKWKKISTIQF